MDLSSHPPGITYFSPPDDDYLNQSKAFGCGLFNNLDRFYVLKIPFYVFLTPFSKIILHFFKKLVFLFKCFFESDEHDVSKITIKLH